MDEPTRLRIEDDIVKMLRTVFDPEIPVDTAPNCPAADFIFEDVRQKVESIDGVTAVNLQLVFEPEWTPDMMTEEAKLEMGML